MNIQTKKDKVKIEKFLTEVVVPNKDNLVSLNVKISNNMKLTNNQKAELLDRVSIAIRTNGHVEAFLTATKEMI